jgi:hypothetical protein
MKVEDLFDLEFEGIDYGDYPDYCDAYLSNASIMENGKARDLTDEELEEIQDENPDWFAEELYDYMH